MLRNRRFEFRTIWHVLRVILCFLFIASLYARFKNNFTVAQETKTSLTGWRAGIARTKITPIEKVWMSGYAGRDRPADETLHDLWAKAILLEDSKKNRNLLISLDLIGIDRELSRSVCREIEKIHKIPRANIAIMTSHTHTGPVVGRNLSSMYFFDDQQKKLVGDYTDKLELKILKTVGDAITNIEPVTLFEGMGQADFAVNRRNNSEKDVPDLRNKNSLKGPIDHELPVLLIKDQAQDLKAILFGYACHATTLSFYKWSGDWPGFAQLEIEKRHPGTVAVFWAGCGADQNPLPRRKVELAENYGKRIADGVDKVLKSGLKPVTGNLEAKYAEIDIPFGDLPSKKQITTDTKSANRYIASRAKHLLRKIETDGSLKATYPYPVQLWRIGEQITFVILGGEVTVDYSIRLKNQLSAERVWVAGYANDVMAYIPSRRVLLEGGYEGDTSMIYYGLPSKWDAEIEELIIAAVQKSAKEMD